MDKLQEFIKNKLFDKNGKMSGQRTKKKWFENRNYISQYNEILSRTSFLDFKSPSFVERLYCVYYNIQSPILCKHCKKNVVNFQKFSIGYSKFCSYECAYKSNERVEKSKQTWMKNLGVDNPSKCETVKQKRISTFLKKWGVDNPAKNDIVKEKIVNTNRDRFGHDYYFQTEDCRVKTRKYSLENFGVEHFTKSKNVKQKVIETNRDTYGCDYHVQSHVKNSEMFTKEFIEQRFLTEEGFLLMEGIQKFFNLTSASIYKRLIKLGVEFTPRLNRSEFEISVFNYIYELDNEIIANDRNLIGKYEIDILIPNKNLAIECNGIRYHDEFHKPDKNFHRIKTMKCKERGFKLLHIFENEWEDVWKRDIWKSMIHSHLGVNKTIYARKCYIKDVNYKDKDKFLNENHLQGTVQSSVNLGLFQDDELVCLITFGKSRYNKNFDWELMRFCNKKYINVVGGFSKLLKNFRESWKGSIITYADTTYSNGDLYRKNGFTFGKYNDPSYFYCKNGFESLSRQSAQKSKLKKLLKNYNPDLTEEQNMYNHNWFKVWRCGTAQFYLQ